MIEEVEKKQQTECARLEWIEQHSFELTRRTLCWCIARVQCHCCVLCDRVHRLCLSSLSLPSALQQVHSVFKGKRELNILNLLRNFVKRSVHAHAQHTAKQRTQNLFENGTKDLTFYCIVSRFVMHIFDCEWLCVLCVLCACCVYSWPVVAGSSHIAAGHTTSRIRLHIDRARWPWIEYAILSGS